jgi:hypothetical protein
MPLLRISISVSRLPLNAGASPYFLKRFLTVSATGSRGLAYAETILLDQVGGAMEPT